MEKETLRLNSRHARYLAELEDAYPEEMRQGEATIRKRLEILESTPWQMSWMFQDQERCLGYLMAYPAYSQWERASHEFVVYIDDLQVAKGAENSLLKLLKLFVADLQSLGLDDLPVEGVCRPHSWRVFQKHQAIVRALGWKLERTHSYWCPKAGETLTWIRWVPVSDRKRAVLEHLSRVGRSIMSHVLVNDSPIALGPLARKPVKVPLKPGLGKFLGLPY